MTNDLIVYDNPAADLLYSTKDELLTLDQAATLCDVGHDRICIAFLGGKINPAVEPRRERGELLFMRSEILRGLREGVFDV